VSVKKDHGLLPLLITSLFFLVFLFVLTNSVQHPQRLSSSAAETVTCTTICKNVTDCRENKLCSGTVGAYCGITSTGVRKYYCTYKKCTTVCPTPTLIKFATPTPTKKPAPTPTSVPLTKPTLISPNGGEVWERGKTYSVTWSQTQKAASTALFIYTRNGTTDTYIGPIAYQVSNVVGNNTYSWTIPQLGGQSTTPPDGSNIIVSVAQYDSSGNRLVEDKSDTIFTITTPKPTILTPNGGETWLRGQTYSIIWNQSFQGASTGLFLYTRDPSGDTYLGAIAYGVSNTVGNNNSYSWTIPQLGDKSTTPPDGSNIIVSVAQYDSSGNRLVEDKSDRPFTVYTK